MFTLTFPSLTLNSEGLSHSRKGSPAAGMKCCRWSGQRQQHSKSTTLRNGTPRNVYSLPHDLTTYPHTAVLYWNGLQINIPVYLGKGASRQCCSCSGVPPEPRIYKACTCQLRFLYVMTQQKILESSCNQTGCLSFMSTKSCLIPSEATAQNGEG